MASRSLNKVMLIGNMTRDPELRYTPQGTAVCTFGLATNRTWVSDGQPQEDVEFHRIVAWQKLAELCSQLLFKGRKVFVEGRLQTRRWTGKDGQERQTTEVVIDNMLVLDSRRKEGDLVGKEEVSAAGGGAAVPDDSGQTQTPVEEPEEKEEEKKEKKTAPAPSSAKASGGKKVKAPSGVDKAAKKEADAAEATVAEEEEKVSADDIPF